jgi:hypothetical protein
MSKGSTNSSKIKNKRVRYYKTKNYELEKNIDFYINPTRIKINKTTLTFSKTPFFLFLISLKYDIS